jgi:hypothetical protein
MNAAMMWFEKDEKMTLEARVQKAVEYYQKKYNHKPNLCLVHVGALSQLNTKQIEVNGVQVREFKPVLPNHLWIGVGE